MVNIIAVCVFAATGIDTMWEKGIDLIADLGDAIADILFVHIAPALFANFFTLIFGGSGLTMENAFLVVLVLVLGGLYIKYVNPFGG